MLIAQITDFHVTALGTRAFGRVDTNAGLAAAVAHLNRLRPRPDLVLVTGDLVNDGRPEEYAALAELLRPLEIPCRVIPGNHDDRAGLRRLFGSDGYLPVEGTFLHYTVEDWPLRIIALDTQVPGRPHGELCRARLDWLAARLAEQPDRPTLLMMHHPPFATGIGHMDAMGCLGTSRLAELVERHGRIQAILCGHLHRAIAVRWAGMLASTAPGTAHQVGLDLVPGSPAAWTLEPPAVALHLWRPELGGVISHLSFVGNFPAVPFGAPPAAPSPVEGETPPGVGIGQPPRLADRC